MKCCKTGVGIPPPPPQSAYLIVRSGKSSRQRSYSRVRVCAFCIGGEKLLIDCGGVVVSLENRQAIDVNEAKTINANDAFFGGELRLAA